MAQYVTIRVLDVKSKDNTHFKLRLDQKLGVMFREYSRRRDNLAFSFLLDGDVIDAEHTARLLARRCNMQKLLKSLRCIILFAG